MNKKTMNMDDIIRFSEGFERDEFIDKEDLEEEFIENDFYDNRRMNLNEEAFNDDFYYINDSVDNQNEEELILNLINSDDENYECDFHEEHHEENHEENHEIHCSQEIEEDNEAEAYYTECNYTCRCSSDDTLNLGNECGCNEENQEDECSTKVDKCQGKYDEGYADGFTAGYEKAKQEVIDYINKRKKRNRSHKCGCKCCHKCCCRNC